jgi:guanylate kinase
VVSGPSGVGKGTLIREVLAAHPNARRSISCTTRPPRCGERDGEDYHFVCAERFAQMREAGQFLEWAVVHQDIHYGTPRAPVERSLAEGKSVILEIDCQGAQTVRETMGAQSASVFVAPPSWEALVERLCGRGTESPDAVSKRVASARRELAEIGQFDYIVVNECIPAASEQLLAILVAEECRRERCDWRGLQARLLAGAGE